MLVSTFIKSFLEFLILVNQHQLLYTAKFFEDFFQFSSTCQIYNFSDLSYKSLFYYIFIASIFADYLLLFQLFNFFFFAPSGRKKCTFGNKNQNISHDVSRMQRRIFLSTVAEPTHGKSYSVLLTSSSQLNFQNLIVPYLYLYIKI